MSDYGRGRQFSTLVTNERLTAVAIKQLDGRILQNGCRSHWVLRRAYNYADPMSTLATDVDGFVTSTGRFVNRREAQLIGVASGQLGKQWETLGGRDMLSSDVNWEAKK